MENALTRPLKAMLYNPVAFATPVLAVLVIWGALPIDARDADLASHFVAQYALGAIVLLAACSVFKTPKIFWTVLIAIFAFSLFQLKPFFPHGGDIVAGSKSLKILQSNVLFVNDNPEPLKKLIETERPDIIVTAETPPAFAKMFATLKKEYPYQNVHPEAKTPRGLGVLSKIPFKKIEMTSFDNPGIPSQMFTLRHAGKDITFLSLHPFTPTENMVRRNNEFVLVAQRLLKEKPDNLIVLGDFNATPYCQAYKKLVTTLSLRNARQGKGIYPTWPTFLPAPLRIPIDHTLVSENIAVADYRTGPNIGSDHLPTITEIALKDTQKDKP